MAFNRKVRIEDRLVYCKQQQLYGECCCPTSRSRITFAEREIFNQPEVCGSDEMIEAIYMTEMLFPVVKVE